MKNKIKEFLRFVLGTIIIITGVLGSVIYVGKSNPISFIEQLKAIIYLVIVIVSCSHYGTSIIFNKTL